MNKKLVILFLLFLTGLSAAFYSIDLVQENPETVFLTTDGIKEYEKFLATVPERKVAIFKVNLPNGISKESYLQFEEKTLKLLTNFKDQFDFLMPRDLFTSSTKFDQSLKDKHFPDGQIKLLGHKFISFLAIEKKSHTKFHDLINSVMSTSDQLEIAGIPYTNYLLDQYSKSIKEKVFPMMFAFAFLFILILTRNLKTSLFLFLPCLFSAVISLSTLKFLYSTMNMITSIIPLMCFTINLAVVFHLFFTMKSVESFKKVLELKLTPIVLMVVTTCIGFGSLTVSSIEAISTFGKLSALLIVLTTTFSIFWIYASEKYISPQGKLSFRFDFLRSYFHKSFSYPVIIILALVSLGTGTYFLGKIEIITDATRYFPLESGLKSSIDSVNKSVAGIPLYEIILEKNGETLESFQKLNSLEIKLSRELQSISGYRGILSLNSMIKNANMEYLGERKLPNSINAFHVLRGRLKESIKESFPTGKHYKLSILGSPINVAGYESGLKIISSFFEKEKISYKVNGLYYNLMISQKTMISILFKSFLLALLIVSTISFLYLKSFKVFFIFLFVNIVPVFLSFGFMYLLGFSINIATVMTYSIALGMIVDSSFHLVHNFNRRGEADYSEYFTTTVLPILGSSILLVISFSLFGFNGFLPIKQFGLNLSIILTLGLVFDLYILPTLYLGKNGIKEAFDVSHL